MIGISIGFDFSQFGVGVHAGRGRVTLMLTWLFVTVVVNSKE